MLDVKALFVAFLEDEAAAAAKRGSKAAFQIRRAIELLAAVSSVTDLKSLRAVKYVGERTVTLLVNRLVVHCKQEGVEFPREFEIKRPREDDAEIANADAAPPKKRTRLYVPTKRSGGYAILLALYSQDYNRDGLTQEEIIQHATPFCDRSFKSNPAANQFYSAWTAMKALEKNDLVKSSGRPKRYYLTDEGLELAAKLKGAEGITTPAKTTTTGVPMEALHSYAGIKYDEWGPDDYTIILVIDTREVRSQSERDYFRKNVALAGVECQVQPLAVGDGLWIARHVRTGEEVVLNYIFERKRIDDLAFLIRDGRFLEQKTRLKMAAMKYNYYIVEEAGFDLLRVAVSGEALQTAISATLTSSDFYLRKFKTIEDTTAFLVSLSEAIRQHHLHKRLVVLKPANLRNQADYGPTIALFRAKFESTHTQAHLECVYTFETFRVMMAKSMSTVRETFLQMLMCIRGVSFEKAHTLQRHFGTPTGLLEFFESHKHLTEPQQARLISETFKHQVGNRKIGLALSEKIYQAWGA